MFEYQQAVYYQYFDSLNNVKYPGMHEIKLCIEYSEDNIYTP